MTSAPTFAVIGAAGQVGQEFVKLLPAERLQTFTRADVDVVDRDSVARLFDRITSDYVINLAAFHNTDACELDPSKAFAVNAIGAWHVASCAAQHGRRCCFVSTDYVFGRSDGDRRSGYLEHDAIAPVNVYGASKAAGEQMVRAVSDQHLIVRTSSLFGAVTSRKGWTFPQMILNKARNGDRLRVVTDQVMAPTYTLDLVTRMLALMVQGATGVCHVANAGSCSWWDFATATLSAAGINDPIEPVPSSTFPSKARRPSFSALGTSRVAELHLAPMRSWRDALSAYLIETGERPRMTEAAL